MSQRAPLPAVPIRTPLTNSDGTLNQTWMKFFQKNAVAASGASGSGGNSGDSAVTVLSVPVTY